MKTQERNSVRILLVDDEPIVLNTLSHGLGGLGYLIQAYENPTEALEHYRHNPPDIVITDYRMPGMDGIRFARTLLEHHHCPIIMLSAYNDLPLVREAIGVGISAYLVKPVEAERLAPTIEAALARFTEISALLKQGADLRLGMENNRVINIAVGIIMVHHKLPQDLAFEALRRLSRDQRRSLRDVAFDLVDSTSNANAVLQLLHTPE
jgi:response regulator NasT